MRHDWESLKSRYEEWLAKHGSDPQGVGWTNVDDLSARFDSLLSITKSSPSRSGSAKLVDLGCGTGLMFDHINRLDDYRSIDYHGIDILPNMIEVAQTRSPGASFEVRDVIADPLPPLSVDYVVMNGVLTWKHDVSREQMMAFAKDLIKSAYASARIGIAFNVMSRHVDWERDDLFHWSFDEVASFLTSDVTRHIAFRSDYGLYELSAFAYRSPIRRDAD